MFCQILQTYAGDHVCFFFSVSFAVSGEFSNMASIVLPTTEVVQITSFLCFKKR